MGVLRRRRVSTASSLVSCFFFFLFPLKEDRRLAVLEVMSPTARIKARPRGCPPCERKEEKEYFLNWKEKKKERGEMK
jgi:hypothetical protein